jgi:hypothetical protein
VALVGLSLFHLLLLIFLLFLQALVGLQGMRVCSSGIDDPALHSC